MNERIVIVTGASKGIGEATAEKFARNQDITYFVSRSGSEKKCKLLKGKGFNAYSYKCDLSNENQVRRMVKFIVKKHSRADVLVNCAGIVEPGKVDEISLKEWNFIINNNLTNAFLMCKYLAPFMKKHNYGKIISVSSIAGRSNSKFAGVHYVSAKAALIGLTRQLAYELGPHKINVNCVAPGQTRTEMLKSVLTPEKEEALKKVIPLGYIAEPMQIANVIFFLASDEANYINGATIDVNGGQL
ncbi:MAG TPA: SDR family NAD(P)-dependent oxidoreductase [archaeon]|nr:SDR family NAD(P)-dependent oxidoreductase [archaeon]